MSEDRIILTIRSSVTLYTRNLTDLELAALNNFAQQNIDPRHQEWYSKVSPLFTEDHGIRMHDVVKDTLAGIVLRRLS